MVFNGIDVSTHNGTIDWYTVSREVDFVFIRAGFGKNNIDAQAINNVKGCIENNIPFGVYWFSYALSEEMAKKEADYACDFADKYKPLYPVCFDWEYASDFYAKKKNICITNTLRKNFARAFLERVKERGYYPMLYTNTDYLSKGFGELTSVYDVWLAQWDVPKPTKPCGIWQSTSSGRINGITGYTDLNIAYKDYTKIANNSNNKTNNTITDKDKLEILSMLKNDFWNRYTTVAKDIIAGKYGNGEERKKKLVSKGYDYYLAQTFVNYMLK